MPRRMVLLGAVASVVLAATGSAQIPDWVTQILAAADLPVSAAQARDEGAPSDEVRAVLDAMRRARVPAHEARTVIDEERTARREHGPVDNFGAFVQSKLDAGLRGRDLAAAIRAEHAARGKGGGRAGQGTKGQGAKGPPASRGSSKADPTDTASRGRGEKAGPPARRRP